MPVLTQTWVPAHLELGAPLIDGVYDTAVFPLGFEFQAIDRSNRAGVFIFLQGIANTALGSWVTYNARAGTTALLAANAIGPVAVAMAAIVANKFGWYQVSGIALAKVSAGFVDNANLYATATAGEADDAVVAGDRIKLAKGASAVSGGVASVEIYRPFMDDGVAA